MTIKPSRRKSSSNAKQGTCSSKVVTTHERDGVTERNTVVAGMPPEDALGLGADSLAIVGDVQPGSDIVEEADGGRPAVAVTQKC